MTGALHPVQAMDSRADEAVSAEQPVNIEIITQLNFSKASMKSRGTGQIVIDPNSGARMVGGALVDLGGGGFVGSARVTGEPGRHIRIDMPHTVRMTSTGGGVIEINNLRTDLTNGPVLDIAGRLNFNFGGDLIVNGAVSGTFRGRIPITAEYE